jgi:hypothetical protein
VGAAPGLPIALQDNCDRERARPAETKYLQSSLCPFGLLFVCPIIENIARVVGMDAEMGILIIYKVYAMAADRLLECRLPLSLHPDSQVDR